jgi:hypothetical protein
VKGEGKEDNGKGGRCQDGGGEGNEEKGNWEEGW